MTREPSASLTDISPTVLRAIEMVEKGTPKRAVAREVGIGRSTLYRWLNDADLRDRARAYFTALRRDRRTVARERAAEMLANGDRIGDIAERVGVDRRTIWKWCREPAYLAEIEAARRAVADHVGFRLALAAGEAVDVLREMMLDPEIAPRERRLAAEGILERALPSSLGLVEARASATATVPSPIVDSRPNLDELKPKELHAITRILLTADARQGPGGGETRAD